MSMASGETQRLHTMDDDITFERVRSMPRKTSFASTHRKLSWECERDVKQFERDRKLVTVELSREQTLLTEKMAKFRERKRQLQERKLSTERGAAGGLPRRESEPCMTPAGKTGGDGSQGPAERRGSVADGAYPKGHAIYRRRNTMPNLATAARAVKLDRTVSIAEHHQE